MQAKDLADWLVEKLASKTNLPRTAINVDEPLSSHGLDSEAVVALTGEISEKLGREIDPTLFYSYPTIATVSAYLCEIAPTIPSKRKAARSIATESEPVAIIGLACRFPGAPDKDRFWALLTSRQDAISDQGLARWGLGAPLSTKFDTITRGGFIDGIDSFAGEFFGIRGDEARRMDPQQRLLLEVSWDALQDAGLSIERIKGSACAVYVGISTNEYGKRQTDNLGAVGALTGTGNALSVAANRLSYAFDLRGESMAVDTACSSSLVALSLAVENLRRGGASTAIVGGVNLLLDPELSWGLSKAGMLAADGKCKTFDEAANGYVRGEGCGVVVLKKLSAAIRDRDQIYAVIKDVTVNQDGRSNGLTAPNGLAQQALVREALAAAGVEPSSVAYVEAHGTGTPLGDPIEANALASVLATAGKPIGLGSVKTNIGHLEAAAGIASIIKVALSIRNGVVPPTINFRRLNPKVNLGPLEVATVGWVLPEQSEARICGVSSFGFGGTNAHAILTGAPVDAKPPTSEDASSPSILIPLSAADEPELRAFAARLVDRLDGGAVVLADLAYTLAVRRDHQRVRAALVVADADELRSTLAGLASQRLRRSTRVPQVAMIFAGQGSQASDMTKALATAEPLAESVLRRCDEIVRQAVGWSLLETLENDPAILRDTSRLQPCLVAYGAMLVELYRSRGLIPNIVIGHSVGEIPAAYAAGALSLEKAIMLACRRGAVMADGFGRGAMLALQISAVEAERLIQPGLVELAVVNGPSEIVLSGDRRVLESIRAETMAKGHGSVWVNEDYAFHSFQMIAPAKNLERALGAFIPSDGSTKFVSTVTAMLTPGRDLDVGYWHRNIVEPVRFAEAVSTIADQVDVVIEIGARPVLQRTLREMLPTAVTVTSSAKLGVDEHRAWLTSLGCAFEQGCRLNFHSMFHRSHPMVDVPTPRLPSERYWLERGQVMAPTTDSLLGQRLDLAPTVGVQVWQSDLKLDGYPFLADHIVDGAVIVPAAAQLAIMLQAARACGLGPTIDIEDVVFRRPIVLEGHGAVLQTIARPTGKGVTLEIAVVPRDSGGGYITCCSGQAMTSPDLPRLEDVHLAVAGHPQTSNSLYADLAKRGLSYGASFQPILEVRSDRHRACGVLRANAEVRRSADAALTVMIDGGFQILAATDEGDNSLDLLIPAAIKCARFHPASAAEGTASVELHNPAVHQRRQANVIIHSTLGPLVEIEGLTLAASRTSAKTIHPPPLKTYECVWRGASVEGRGALGNLVLVCGASSLAGAVWQAATSADAHVVKIPVVPEEDSGSGFDLTCPVQWRGRLRLAAQAAPSASAVVLLVDDCVGPFPDRASQALHIGQVARAVVQAAAHAPFDSPPRLCFVSRGAVVTGLYEREINPVGSAAIGIARAAHFEAPGLNCICVDLDPASPPDLSANQLIGELDAASAESEVAYRAGQRLVRRVQSFRPAQARALTPDIFPDATYVVTGGTGALGSLAVKWLCELGAGNVLVISRNRPPDPWFADLAQHRERVTHVSVDIGNGAAVSQLIAEIPQDRPLKGIIHAAGLLEDGPLMTLSAESLTRVFEPKVDGIEALWRACSDLELDWLVLYSSAASTLGSPGQANYVAANAYLDAFGEYARGKGVRVFCCNWGPWAEQGMAQAIDGSGPLAGLSLIQPLDGMAALYWGLATGVRSALMLPFELESLIQYYPEGPGFALFEDLLADAKVNLRSAGDRLTVAQRPALETPYVEPGTALEKLIARMWCKALGVDRIGLNDNFFALGGDSVLGNQIFVEISTVLGVSISPEEAFENLTVAELVTLAEQRATDMIAEMDDATVQQLTAAS